MQTVLEVIRMICKIGLQKNGAPIFLSTLAVNRHMAYLGVTGSGKTTRMRENIVALVEQGATVLTFDLNGILEGYPSELSNCIDLLKDGMNLPILDLTRVKKGEEAFINYVSFMVNIVSGGQNLGCRQQGVLREAIIEALEQKDDYSNDLEAIASTLRAIDTAVAESVYTKLWETLSSNAFRNGGKSLMSGKINIIRMSTMTETTQRCLIELILGMIWREFRFLDTGKDRMFIAIDELQSLNLSYQSVLMQILCQGRQKGLNVWMATQSTKFFKGELKAAVDQADTKLYFKPSTGDIGDVAKYIDDRNESKTLLLLKRLKIGEALIDGKIVIDEKEVTGPYISVGCKSFENKVFANNRRRKQLFLELKEQDDDYYAKEDSF